MKITLAQKLAAVFLGTIALAGSASAGLIVCPGGRYCEELRQECIASGQHLPAYCEAVWRNCVLDACPQR
ncbi:hypothetical protein [Stenotrophomonas sp.]|jgi:hypothetical protein|uniref:hypothetical protein n=1 Tax=Stenotrophomonas sp. TaxID=69392 RepID=UPI0029A8F9AC|nr:hypothetical protein [Stenotrophomonas sp.]MDX3934999.1 hypothetical protein [Stenotrophomonas sp.]